MSIHKVINGEMKEIASNTRWDATTKTLSIDGVKCFSANELVQDANCFLALDAHQVQIADNGILTVNHDGYLVGSIIPWLESDITTLIWFRKTDKDSWMPLFIMTKFPNPMQINLYVKNGYQFFFTKQPGSNIDIDTAVVVQTQHTLALYY